MRFIRGVVIANWKLYPMPRAFVQQWTTVAICWHPFGGEHFSILSHMSAFEVETCSFSFDIVLFLESDQLIWWRHQGRVNVVSNKLTLFCLSTKGFPGRQRNPTNKLLISWINTLIGRIFYSCFYRSSNCVCDVLLCVAPAALRSSTINVACTTTKRMLPIIPCLSGATSWLHDDVINYTYSWNTNVLCSEWNKRKSLVFVTWLFIFDV